MIDPVERDLRNYEDAIAQSTADEEAAWQNFLQGDWDGDMLKEVMGFESLDVNTANELAWRWRQWYEGSYEVTDYPLVMLFRDIRDAVTEWVEG